MYENFYRNAFERAYNMHNYVFLRASLDATRYDRERNGTHNDVLFFIFFRDESSVRTTSVSRGF